MKKWLIGGIIGSVVLLIALFMFTYVVDTKTSSYGVGVVPLFPFPPDFLFITVASLVGFGIGALIGLLIEHVQSKSTNEM